MEGSGCQHKLNPAGTEQQSLQEIAGLEACHLWAEGLAQPETGAFVGGGGQRPQVAAQKLRVPIFMKSASHRGSQWRQARSSRNAVASAVDIPLTSTALPKVFLHATQDTNSAEGTGAALTARASSHVALQPWLGIGSTHRQDASTAWQVCSAVPRTSRQTRQKSQCAASGQTC